MLKTIEALEKDILLQIQCLSKFRLQPMLTTAQQKNSIFCGSGDSLAACMLAEAFSGYKVKATDPLDLLKNKSIPKENDVYIVSISGRTISNINVAKLARKSIALTSNPQSKLSQICDKTILLQFPNSDVVTAGSISFLESALTCISLVNNFKVPNVDSLFKAALSQSKKIRLQNRIFFLGNMHTYPIAMYAAAKLYEILGFPAYYEKLEQFSHMELFSCKKGDTVVIFEERNSHNSKLLTNLKTGGLNVIHPVPPSKNKISQFLFFTFLAQLTPLFIAKKTHQKECYFVTAKKLRKISDNMIY